MAGTPSLMFSDGGGAVPFTVALAPGQDIELASVTAVWNGAGASGSFLACLSLYSQEGVLLSRTFPATTFGNGDSGEVTYAPFLGESGIGPLGTVPLCKVTHSADLAIADGFAYLGPQPWDTEVFDTFGMHSTTVNNSRITIMAPGKYLLGALWNYTTSAAGDYGVRLRKNGAGGAGEVALGANGNFNVSIGCLFVDQVVVGDFFEVFVVQKTGAGLTSDHTGCEFWATRLGA